MSELNLKAIATTTNGPNTTTARSLGNVLFTFLYAIGRIAWLDRFI